MSGVEMVAQLMAIAATTAPKSKGENPDCKTFQKQKKEKGEFVGPTCAFRLLDMGIALGSAVKTASLLNVDNRIMYRVGVVAREMDIVDWDFVMGIPLSVTGKSIYFDRKG